jgi:hypothetical protein
MEKQPLALRLADEIGEDYCRCLPAYKDRGRTDPQCESCNTEDWRHDAAAELRRLNTENERLKIELQVAQGNEQTLAQMLDARRNI